MQPESISEHDQRQFERMHEALHVVAPNTLSIGSLAGLIRTLDFLVESLDSAGAAWTNAFRSKWGILEEVYAVVLDEGLDDLPSSSRTLLKKALSDLAEMIPSGGCI